MISSAEIRNKTYTREEYVYLAKLYERAERFEDMVFFINKFIELDPNLSHEERNILSAGYKNIISSKRSSWRLINSMEKKEEKKSSPQLEYLKEVKTKIENELTQICSDIQNVVNKYLLPNAKDSETKVFFLKLQGDYFRYKSEYSTGNEFEEACDSAEQAYLKAQEIAEKDLQISSSTRLGLALNFSVFYYEIKGKKEDACNIAKAAFDKAMKVLDELEKVKAKDTLLIIQLLKENLILWEGEMNEDEH